MNKNDIIAFGVIIVVIWLIWGVETLRESRVSKHVKIWSYIAVACLCILVLIFAFRVASARDLGQWDQSSDVTQWYQKLMQPDAPTASCCGEADAYWCDDYYARDGKAFCKITDERPDGPRGRPHRDIGTEFEIPNAKLKYDQSNPTGHGVIFLSRGDYVYCYVAPGGV